MRFFFTLIALIIYGCGESQTKTTTINELGVDNLISKKQANLIFEKTKEFPDHTEVAFAFITNGFTEFYGVKRANDSLINIENNTSAFEIGSITKVFTATLLANFALENKLKLDDYIHNYIDTPIKGDKKLSFKQLSNHTSGLDRLPSNLDLISNPNNPYKNYNEEKLEDYLSNELFLSQQPGEKYEYSNFGAGLLGYVLCKIERTGYQNLLEKYITSKYEMKNSTTIRDEIENILVKGRDVGGNETSNWDLAALVGAGGMLSTTEDLAKFATAQFDESHKELKLTRTKTFQISDITDIGLGWHIINRKSKAVWYCHSGGTGGYSSLILLNPDTKNGIVILSNVSAFHPKRNNIDDLGFDIMKAIDEEYTK
ncbi:CubicO group peptidase (beta-lactamase class C family) [Saonia flava]|uniref:CubicO group peptidase (Beta-lactamase class C family) n=1 Tax=Saonia flava TaxID=523696 RepID=A0A846QWT2_9FLAO|nr:serine hydrolase domain-containing protein [Saonia flava]NJB70055.1 CubicO group peptidase (beta-lactamase class C family) [Saonia flava]